MSQDKQPRLLWKDSWRLLLICVFILVIAFIVVSYALDWWWTGFPSLEATDDKSAPKTLWDWLGLLIIPAVLGFGAILFNQQARKAELELAEQEKKNEQELAKQRRKNDFQIAADRSREDAFQNFLDRMSELVLDQKLRESKEGAAVRDMARARTLAVVRVLAG
jgi:hypothetical protein